jgi:hypothetical protein
LVTRRKRKKSGIAGGAESKILQFIEIGRLSPIEKLASLLIFEVIQPEPEIMTIALDISYEIKGMMYSLEQRA